MLPEEIQFALLDETYLAGLNTASCALVVGVFLLATLVWFSLIRSAERQRLLHAQIQQEQFLVVENSLKKSIFEKQTFELELSELDAKLSECQAKLEEKEERIQALGEAGQASASNAQKFGREVEKLRGSEEKMLKELNGAKLEVVKWKEKFEMQQREFEMRLVGGFRVFKIIAIKISFHSFSKCILIVKSNELFLNLI